MAKINTPTTIVPEEEKKRENLLQNTKDDILFIDSQKLSKANEITLIKNLHNNPDIYESMQYPKKYLLKCLAHYLKQKSDTWSKIVYDWSVDIDSDQGIMSYTCGTVKLGQVCEYGNNVVVWYNGIEQKIHVVYRPALYDDSEDNRWLCFNKTEIVSVKEKNETVTINIKASSNTEERIYQFSFPKTTLFEETKTTTKE